MQVIFDVHLQMRFEFSGPIALTPRFAEMKGPVKDKLKRFGLFGRFGEQAFFPTIEEAVNGYLFLPSAQLSPSGEQLGDDGRSLFPKARLQPRD